MALRSSPMDNVLDVRPLPTAPPAATPTPQSASLVEPTPRSADQSASATPVTTCSRVLVTPAASTALPAVEEPTPTV